jgi:hypothetical protein
LGGMRITTGCSKNKEGMRVTTEGSKNIGMDEDNWRVEQEHRDGWGYLQGGSKTCG